MEQSKNEFEEQLCDDDEHVLDKMYNFCCNFKYRKNRLRMYDKKG